MKDIYGSLLENGNKKSNKKSRVKIYFRNSFILSIIFSLLFCAILLLNSINALLITNNINIDRIITVFVVFSILLSFSYFIDYYISEKKTHL